jgi:hypothetical protein
MVGLQVLIVEEVDMTDVVLDLETEIVVVVTEAAQKAIHGNESVIVTATVVVVLFHVQNHEVVQQANLHVEEFLVHKVQ